MSEYELDKYIDDNYYGNNGAATLPIKMPDDPTYNTEDDFLRYTRPPLVWDSLAAATRENPDLFLNLGATFLSDVLLGLPNAQQWLWHGLNGNGQPLKFDNDSLIANTLKNSNEFSNQIKDVYEKYSEFNKGNQFSYKFEDERDLEYSIGKYSAVIQSAERLDDGSYRLEIKLTDKYDFDAYRDARNSYGNYLNNVGLEAQRAGQLITYNIEVNFTYTFRP
jgi:hypothetical protein